jgi:glycerol-3-phosphate dehydrogenase
VAVKVVMVTGQREDEYDVVVIGGGAAGAVINADLVEEEAREAVVAVPL